MIIGICGRARHGKDSVAEILVKKHGFKRLAFADPLKEAAAVIFGFTPAQLYGDKKESVDPYWGFTPRWALQKLGTEGVRDTIGQDTWVKALGARIARERLDASDIRSAHFVISDVRFPNEADAITGWGGNVWRVFRPHVENVQAHSSETALDHWPVTGTLFNDGTLKDLEAVVTHALLNLPAGGEK